MDSQKQRNFVSEPMGNKPVKDLPGVGRTLAPRFEAAGYDKASQVYGQYLTGNRNPVTFEKFMKGATQCNSNQASNTLNALEKYDKTYNH